MKLSSRPSLAPAQQRQEALRRGRAAAQSLRTAFPSLERLRLDLKFEGPNAPATQAHMLHPPARAFFEFPCPYTDCDGRFDLTRAVQTIMAGPGQESEGVLECHGLRVRQLGARQACGLRLQYQVSATYQPEI